MRTISSPRLVPAKQGISDVAYERYDAVDERVRPMVVGVSYLGRRSEEATKLTTEEMYKMTAREIRDLFHVYDFDHMTEEFHERDISSAQQLLQQMQIRGMSREVCEEILTVVEQDNVAPKFARLYDNQVMVTVGYGDDSTKAKEREQLLEPHTDKTSISMKGFGNA